MASLVPIPLEHPHWECVSDQLREIMVAVGSESFSQRFYLAGGTALALQLGHRVSVDLDFFAPDDDLLDDQRRAIMASLKGHLEFEIVQDVVGSLLLNVGGLALGFFSYRYPLLEQPMLVEQVALAGLVDIGLMKLDAIASRGVKKDFYDLYFIAQTLPLENLLERCREKYPHHRDFGMMALEGLVDFSTADRQADIQTIPPVAWAEVRTFCQQEVRRIGRRWFEA
jgi:hypothetical protein